MSYKDLLVLMNFSPVLSAKRLRLTSGLSEAESNRPDPKYATLRVPKLDWDESHYLNIADHLYKENSKYLHVIASVGS